MIRINVTLLVSDEVRAEVVTLLSEMASYRERSGAVSVTRYWKIVAYGIL